MNFTQFNGAMVASPIGKPSLAYLVRTDNNQISVLNNKNSAGVDWSIYRCHPFTGIEQHRGSRKKIARVIVYGDGQIPTSAGSAFMVVTMDQSRTDVYPYSALSPKPLEGILWSQNTHSLVGRQIDICLFLTGPVTIREIEVSYTPVSGL